MARKTLSKVHLVKTSDHEAQNGLGPHMRDTTYAVVDAKRNLIGTVIGNWGPGSGRGMYVSRTRYERTWQALDANGEKPKGTLGWYDYRDEAVDAVVRSAGLK